MPQMSPYNWLILFIMFIMIFMFIMMLNNYNYTPKFYKKNINFKNKFSWMW